MDPARRILLLEPDPAVRDSLIFSLGLDGFQVEAVDLAAALERMAAGDDACLVIECSPSNPEAQHLLNALTRCPLRRTAVVLATHPYRALSNRVEAAGGVIVEKPLLGDALSEALREIFKRPPANLFAPPAADKTERDRPRAKDR